jgi:hypothetical protein
VRDGPTGNYKYHPIRPLIKIAKHSADGEVKKEAKWKRKRILKEKGTSHEKLSRQRKILSIK